MSPHDKPLVWLHGEIQSPPFSDAARWEAGFRLRQLQGGELLTMPQSRPMPQIGRRCHELRIRDEGHIWRIIYRLDPDAVIIADVFSKTTKTTPKQVIDNSKARLRRYDESVA